MSSTQLQQSYAVASAIAEVVPSAKFCGFKTYLNDKGKVVKHPLSLVGNSVGGELDDSALVTGSQLQTTIINGAQHWGLYMQRPVEHPDGILWCIDVDYKNAKGEQDPRIWAMLKRATELGIMRERSFSLKGAHLFVLAPNDIDLPPKITLADGQEIELFGHSVGSGKSVLLTGYNFAGELHSYPNMRELLNELGISNDLINPTPKPVSRDSKKPSFTPEDDIAAAELALSYVHSYDDYHEWVKIGMALKDKFGQSGFALWDRWSAQSAKYEPDVMQDKWDTFNGSGVSFGTVIHQARQAGMTRPISSHRSPKLEIVKTPSSEISDGESVDWSSLSVDKNGKIINSWTNIQEVIKSYPIGHDRFLDMPMIQENGQWRRFEDTDYVKFALDMEEIGFKTPSINMIKDVVRSVMASKSFDSAIDWLESLVWDGKDRCTRLFSTYFGVEPSPYEQAVSEYFVTAMAGRVLHPGVQADMVPVLVGGQGIGKTSGVKALAPMEDTFAEIDLSGRKDADLARQLRGKLIGELGELRGLKTKDSEWIKAWITRTHEEWTPKFVEHSKNMARRCVFIGTTNEDEFLIDVTGNRRWLPLTINSSCNPLLIKKDIDQIWAQAAVMFKKNFIMWEVAAALSEVVQSEHTQHDDWAMDSIEEVLNMSQFASSDGFKLKDVTDKLFPNIEVSRASQHRIADALRRQGYKRVSKRDGTKVTKFYKKILDENPF